MNEKNMVHSSRLGITRTSSSVYGKDFLELVWENGQIHAGDNNNYRTRNTPFCIGYSVNPSLKNEEDDVIMRSSKRARLSNNSYKPNQEFPNLKTSKLISWGPQKPFTAVVTNSHSQETKKPRIHSSPTATKKSEKQYLGSSNCCDQRTRKVNFSNFSIPAVFLKSTSARSSARVEKIQYLKGTEEVAASTSNKEADHIGFQEQTSLTAKKAKPESASSEALREKGKADDETNLCNETSSSSVCSLEASNNPNFSIIKHHEDTDDDDDDDDDDSAYLSDDDEETENLVRDSNRIKRTRNAESHSLSERKQRDEINEKIRTLKDLIPNCNKVDKASMLDDAIEYLKTLKLQLEIMSMGRGLCMPHMMLPNHMNVAAQHLMGFSTPPQFPIPPLSSVTDNRLQMFGFSNQMLQPMPIPNAPLFPMIGNSSIQPFNAANLARHLANPGQLTTPEV